MNVEHIALIGLGSIGRRHLRIINKLRPAVKVTLVRSGNGRDWPELSLAHRVVYSLHEAIAEGVQAAIIASPATLHLEQATTLAQAGIHLLIEKPLSHEVEGVDKLLAAVKESGVIGLTGYVLRHDPVAQAFKLLLEDGRLGQLLHVRVEAGSYLPDWRPEQNYRKSVSALAGLGGGVLMELSHEFDYIRWFFGEINSINAHLHNSHHLQIDVEECADIILTGSQGLPISLNLNFHQRNSVRRCIAAGSEGSATWDAIENQILWHPASGEIDIQNFDFERDEMYQAQLKHFFACIEEDNLPQVTLDDGLQTLRLIEAAKLANATGQRQELL